MAGMSKDGVIAGTSGSNYSVYGKNAFTNSGALSVGEAIADGAVHDPIFGRLLNWLILACIFVMIWVFLPIWVIIIIYCYFAHRKGTLEAWELIKDMALGKP